MRTRFIASLGAVSLVVLLAATAPAGATVTQSQVTTPADHTYITANADAHPPNTVTIAGTSNGTSGSDKVDVLCYYGTMSTQIVTGVTVLAGGNFSVSVAASSFTGPFPNPTCALRAVPSGMTPTAPPGSGSPFAGPTVSAGRRQTYTLPGGAGANAGLTWDYDIARAQLGGFVEYNSLGDCGLVNSYVFDPSSFAPSNQLFSCNDSLRSANGNTFGATANRLAPTRSELRIDGVDAYLPGSAQSIFIGAAQNSGYPPLTFSDSVDPSTGNLTITESETPVVCAPVAAIYPPTSTTCSSFTAAPVKVARTTVQDHAGRVVSLFDAWSSTDGAQHQLDAQLENDIYGGNHDTAFEFPWVSSAFLTHSRGDTVPAAPSQPGSIYVKESLAAADGDTTNPQGAITFSSPPDGALFTQDEAGPSNYTAVNFLLNYKRTVPASGSLALGFTYSDAFLASEVQGYAAAAVASSPAVSITAPANGATSAQSPVTVSGTASDVHGLASLTVNGRTVAVAGNGTWSASVALSPGSNTITAIATNIYGNTGQAAISITYAPAPPSPPPPAPGTIQPKLVLAGGPTPVTGAVSFSLACQAAAGASCLGLAQLSTLEKLLGKRIVAVSAKLRKQKRSTKRVIVGSQQFSLTAGHTVKVQVPLNGAGRNLLGRFGRLPVTLKITLMNAAPPTVMTSTTTIRKSTKRRRR